MSEMLKKKLFINVNRFKKIYMYRFLYRNMYLVLSCETPYCPADGSI